MAKKWCADNTTEITAEEYEKRGIEGCPNCGFNDWNMDEVVHATYDGAYLRAQCYSCGCDWTEYYTFEKVVIDNNSLTSKETEDK